MQLLGGAISVIDWNGEARNILNCPYYDREIKDCEGCKLEGYDCSCSHAFLKDVMARIRKLRGED